MDSRMTSAYMLAPALIVLAIISIFPLLYKFYISMFDFTPSVNNPSSWPEQLGSRAEKQHFGPPGSARG
jgi:ABC-type sugar transport system permease subunit